MPPEILALIDKPLSLVAVLFVGALMGMTLEQVVSRQRRAAWKARKIARGEWRTRTGRSETGRFTRGAPPGWTSAWPPGGTTREANAEAEAFPRGGTGKVPDAAEQLRTVMGAAFRPKRLLNRGEERVLSALEPIVARLEPGWRVWTQVSLGEVLVDGEQQPRVAIEYQGQGHHQGAAAARDAVKREALRRAGIGFGEVFAGDGPQELAQVVARMLAGAGVKQTFGVRSAGATRG